MWRIEGRFSSKRNRVWLMSGFKGEVCVLKVYSKPEAGVEARILSRLGAGGLRVPFVLDQGVNWLRLSYFPGRNLCELWEEAEAGGGDGKELLWPLLDWLKQYHSLDLGGLNDLNWRNFILCNDGKVAGLDFEEEGGGTLLEDLGQILAYAITYDPPFSKWKQNWINWALPAIVEYFNFSFNLNILESNYQKALTGLLKRRSSNSEK